MESSFLELVQKIKGSVQQVKTEHGISIEPLDKAIEELEKHSDNIQKIEGNIDSIREEVIAPIKDELAQNKKAGKFSIYGLYVGAAALCIAIVTMILQFTLPFFTNSNKEIQSIKTELADIRIQMSHLPSLGSAPVESGAKAQLEFAYGERSKPILKTENGVITMKPYLIWEEKYRLKWIPSAQLYIFLDDKAIGAAGLPKFIKLVNNSGFAHFDEDKLVMSEGDGIIFSDQYAINVLRIYRSKSNILEIADDRDAVLIEYYKK